MRTYHNDQGLTRRQQVVAPCCGRRVLSDVLLNVESLALELRPRGASYMCDGCKERLFNTGQLTREEFVRQLGASEQLVEKMRGVDGRLCGLQS